MTRVVLDLSRLISRVRHGRPSGVDRVEMAYARGLMDRFGDDLAFAALHPAGSYGRIGQNVALAYLNELEARWASPKGPVGQKSLTSIMPWMARLMPDRSKIGTSDVLIQVSPHHLHQTEKQRAILSRERARFVCMVHDLIPIEFPEYARPGGSALHAARMTSVAELADAVIVNSAATGASLARWIEGYGGTLPPIHVALLGTHLLPAAPPWTPRDGKPFFVCLGTIEPRKNHLLLLHLWRQMAETLSDDQMPRLIVIGRRGWENEQIVDLLDRCTTLRPFVDEVNNCGDVELAGILRGARALLMPSFAEGYGMPIAEALSVGTPVVASDLPAHREAGGAAPDYLDPLDGLGWMRAIHEYAHDESGRRRAQLERINQWHAPAWPKHMEIAADAIRSIAG